MAEGREVGSAVRRKVMPLDVNFLISDDKV
jgi:hypothetical protein